MKPEEQKILNDSLSKLFKIDQEKLASLYNEAGDLTDLSIVIEADAQRMANFKTEKDNQYKRGVKEAAQKLEGAIKDRYGVESELEGVDLVDHLLVLKAEEFKSKENIKNHPEFLKARSDWEKEQKLRDKDWEKKLEDKDREYNRMKIFDTVKNRAMALLTEAKPILPTDPQKAESWKGIFLRELESGNYQVSDDGTIIVLDKEGNPLKDPHGYGKTFNDYAKEVADKYFEYQKAEDRSSSGVSDKDKGGSGGGTFSFTPPRNEDERLALLRNPKITPQQRKEITEYVIKN